MGLTLVIVAGREREGRNVTLANGFETGANLSSQATGCLKVCVQLGLNPTTCVAEPASMRLDKIKKFPCRSLSSAATESGPSKKVSTSRSLKQKDVSQPTQP